MRLIPGKTKVQIELFKGISLWDMLVGAVMVLLGIFVLFSNLPGKYYILLIIVVIAVGLLTRLDTVPNYQLLMHVLRFYGYGRRYERKNDEKIKELATPLTPYKKEDKKPAEEEVSEDTGEKASEEETAESKADKKASKKDTRKKTSKKKASKKKEAEKSSVKTSDKKDSKKKEKKKKVKDIKDIIAFTNVKDDCIEYDGKYYGAAIEISPVEFRFFSPYRRRSTIEDSVGRILRSLNPDYAANIVKIERPIQYESYLEKEYDKLDELRTSYENGLLTEEELQPRVEILYDRINELHTLCGNKKIIAPFYYLVLYERDKKQLNNQIDNALELLRVGEIDAKRLNTKELAVFLKYSNQIDFEEHDIDKLEPEDYAKWAMPESISLTPRRVIANNIISYTMRIVGYPSVVDDAWMASVMSMPGTKCVIKCRPMDRYKAIRNIDRSLQELRGQLMTSTLDSKIIELNEHIETLSELLGTLQQDNEALLETNIYITAYDIVTTRSESSIDQPPISFFPVIAGMKKRVRRLYQENGFKLNSMEFDQLQGFIGAQVSGLDPLPKEGRGIPSNTVAASYPWVFASVSDEGGIHLGSSDGVPVFVDFFRRDSERVNSNMVIVGKSGSGKSYATKDILANLAAEDSKIFILDPENEYSEMAKNLHGKFINVGNAQQGRINPFHIITALDDDEGEGSGVTGSYATHLQFLEEFFRQIIPDCDNDAMEYLNTLVDRMYMGFGITPETDLSKLGPEDYPIFDDLYDVILEEFQKTDNEYIRSILRILMNYIAKFSTGGRNANIWNGPSTITTDENFTVFNFQSLLANRNGTIANAQMLLVLKYVDNEIIKNRDYNTRYKLHRKVVVVIDEAHVFIDTKFPVALDFMFQLAKRIRKYNGMQIVITQNIKDFVGSEEIARKSTAIINACQYSFIFALAPNDIQDLCTLYEKAGGINETEQEQITSAPRGQAFSVMGPSSRSTFKIEVPEEVVEIFQEQQFKSRYFIGEKGAKNWENFIGESREIRAQNVQDRVADNEQEEVLEVKSKVNFVEITEEELLKEQKPETSHRGVSFEEFTEPPASGSVSFKEFTEPPASGGVSFKEYTEPPVTSVSFEEVKELSKAQEIKELSKAASVQLQQNIELSKANEQMLATQEMLSDLLQEFGRDAMKYRVQDEVQKQIEKVLGQNVLLSAIQSENSQNKEQRDVIPKTPAAEKPYVEPVKEPEKPKGITAEQLEKEIEESLNDKEQDLLFEKILSGDTVEEDKEETAAYDDSADDGFDIMSLLTEQLDSLDNVSSIEMMDAYGETVIDITLEDLAVYIQNTIYGG